MTEISSHKNNDLYKLKDDIIENYEHFSYPYYYHMFGDLPSASCCNVIIPYRTVYDQYWTKFYCEKSMNTNYDLLSLTFR